MRLRELFEAPATAVMAFGRMNPPTIGHEKLVNTIKSQPGDPFIFLSQSQKPKTDPLAFQDKLRYAKFFFPNVTIGNPEVKTIIQALQKVESLGYQELIYVAGSDRVQAFEELLNKYNGKDFTFKSIKVISAGERDPDADGADGMSASKMRQAAVDNDIESFKQGVPQQEVADEMFAAVRKGMGVADTVPAEGIQENITSADIPVVTYDRNYGGDVNKVLAVKRDAKADAEALYKKLGGVSDANYQIISKAAEQKKQELRQVYRDALAKQGIKGAKALRTPEYLLFRKQNADMSIMLGTAMDMTNNGTGKIIEPKGKILKPNEGIEKVQEKDLDDITLQRVLKFGAEIDADKERNPGAFSMTGKATRDLIAKARAQAKRDRVTNVPSRAHDKDGVHKQGFKPVKFPKSNSISNFKLADD